MVLCVGRYMAPELYRGPQYEKSVDVFSFALIVQEVSSNLSICFSQLLHILKLSIDTHVMGLQSVLKLVVMYAHHLRSFQ